MDSEVRSHPGRWHAHAPLREGMVHGMRVLLGTILCVSGTSKLLVMSGFAATVSELFQCSGTTAGILALGLVAVEGLLGLGLLLGRRVYLFAGGACGLFGLFLWVLGDALTHGREILCHCFGALPFRLSNQMEFVVDLALFNASAFLALDHDSIRRFRAGAAGARRIALRLAAAGLFAGQGLLLVGVLSSENRSDALNLPALVRFTEAETDRFAGKTQGRRLLLVIELHDFNCLPCFEDFLALCDEIQSDSSIVEEQQVALVIRQPGDGGSTSPEMLKAWARETGVTFAVAVLPESAAAELGIRKSFGVVFSGDGREVLRREMPIGRSVRKQMLQLLEQNGEGGVLQRRHLSSSGR
jgi:Methylamine utilisation protein MauE